MGKNFGDDYIEWLKQRIKTTELLDGVISVTTPFLDRHNDYTEIFIIKEDSDKYKLTDDGYIIADLESMGISVDYGTRFELLKEITSSRGIFYDSYSKELYGISNKQQLPEMQHRLLQCMLDVNDMFFLTKNRVHNTFIEDVSVFFEKNDIYYTRNPVLIGTSSYNQVFDFLLQRNKFYPERYIKVINKLNKINAERLAFSWLDTQEARLSRNYDTQLYTIYNDNLSDSERPKKILKNHGVQIIPWSHIENYVPQFS